MRNWWWAAVAALVIVAGCHKGDDSAAASGGDRPAASPDSGQAASADADTPSPYANDEDLIEELPPGVESETYNGELPPGWPSQAQLYPDAAIGKTTVSQLPNGPAFSVKLMTTAPPAEVSDFHLKQADALHADVSELTLSPTRAIVTYFCADYVMSVQAEEHEDGTTITIHLDPPAPKDQVLPHMRQYVNLDKVPDDFPEDLIPRYPGSVVINGFTDGPDHCSIEMTTADDLQTAADYYRDHFSKLGWAESSKSEAAIVRAYTYKQGQDKIVLNVGSGGEGEKNHISISFTRKE